MSKPKYFRQNDHVRIKKNVISTWHGTGRLAHDQDYDHQVLRIIRDDGDGSIFQSCIAMPHQITRVKSKPSHENTRTRTQATT